MPNMLSSWNKVVIIIVVVLKNKRSNVMLNMSLYLNFSEAVVHVYYYYKKSPTTTSEWSKIWRIYFAARERKIRIGRPQSSQA